jgi:hypothetical protein
MTAQRVITSAGELTSHYTGVGYQYFYTKSPQKGNTCKMQVAKSMLEDFERSKGRINTMGMPHLQVLDQGNGWWLICSDQPENDGVVTDFIARFNRWALKRADAKPAPTPAPAKARYTIEVKNQGPAKPNERRSSAQPVSATPDLLQALAQTVNGRYGHNKRK